MTSPNDHASTTSMNYNVQLSASSSLGGEIVSPPKSDALFYNMKFFHHFSCFILTSEQYCL